MLKKDTKINSQMRDAVIAALPLIVRQLSREMFPLATRNGSEVRAGDITGSPGSSFSLKTQGPKVGLWRDFSTGAGGDIFSLLMERYGFTFPEALRWLGERAGFNCNAPEAVNRIRREANRESDRAAAAAKAKAKSMLDYARSVWKSSKRVTAGDPVDLYLKSRSIDIPLDHPCFDSIRFNEQHSIDRRTGPAMISIRTCFEDPDLFCGIHRTALVKSLDSKGKMRNVKKMAGTVEGSSPVVRLCDDADITTGLSVAEGIETSLSLISSGIDPVVATLSSGSMSRFPASPGIESLTIVADRDPAGLSAAKMLMAQWSSASREVRFFAPFNEGEDYNDILRGAA